MKDNKAEAKSVAKRKKRRIKIGFRAVILAMLMALLFFLGWDGMGFGQGSGNNQTEGSVDESAENTDDDDTVKQGDDEDSYSYAVYVVEDKIYIDHEEVEGKLMPIDLQDLEKRLKEMDIDKGHLVLYDAGALSGTYEDVLELVKEFEFVYREESISLEEDRF